jgi:hypothetical protein
MSSFTLVVAYALLVATLFYVHNMTVNILEHMSSFCWMSQEFLDAHDDIICFKDVGAYSSPSSGVAAIAFHGAHSLHLLLLWQWRICIIVITVFLLCIFKTLYRMVRI